MRILADDEPGEIACLAWVSNAKPARGRSRWAIVARAICEAVLADRVVLSVEHARLLAGLAAGVEDRTVEEQAALDWLDDAVAEIVE